MPKLNKFIFKIETNIRWKNKKIVLSSNADIQRSFIERIYGQVDSHVENLRAEGESKCLIYSHPYQFDTFFYINNTFQGGMFDHVQCILMLDSRPFEYNFFKIISQDFPFLIQLYVLNDQPQKEKQQSSTPIIFPHLIFLDLVWHVDYAEQFLVDKTVIYLVCSIFASNMNHLQ
jgi:hypothetical protein